MASAHLAARKIVALATKDFIDLFKNPGMFVCLVMPVGLVAMQAFLMPADAIDAARADAAMAQILASTLLVSSIAISIAMVGSMAILYSLAEEKEKHTLRTLILSNVSAEQVMVSKALVGMVGIVAVELACFFIVQRQIPGVSMGMLPAYLLLGTLGGATVVLPSLVLGLACRDQMTASFYSVPIVVLSIAPIFGMFTEAAGRVTRFAPTGGVCELLDMVFTGTFTWSDAMLPLGITVAWIVGGAVLFRLLYRKLAQDN